MTGRSIDSASRILGTISLLVAALAIAACSSLPETEQPPAAVMTPVPTLTKDSNWSLEGPNDDNVVFHGVASFDKAGLDQHGMVYPAPNAIVAVVAVITHGIVDEAARKSQKDGIQEAADRVLLPYQDVLHRYSYNELMQRGQKRVSVGHAAGLVGPTDKTRTDWLVVCAPVFSMTQDQTAIVLDDPISIYPPGSSSTAAYQKVIRVVSRAKDVDDLVGFWTANQGEALKAESAGLLAESLNIALSDAAGGLSQGGEAFKTVRYLQGGDEKIERAQLISDHCGRLVIKTLRGALMSVPVRQGTATAPVADQCAGASASLK